MAKLLYNIQIHVSAGYGRLTFFGLRFWQKCIIGDHDMLQRFHVICTLIYKRDVIIYNFYLIKNVIYRMCIGTITQRDEF